MNKSLFKMFSVVTILALMLIALPVQSALAAPTELFFSEYIEGSSNNKALEIYNGTGASINLATDVYSIQMFFNGSAAAALTINLTGTVADGDVYVIAQSSASPTILAQADQTQGSGWFNGDDAVVLRKGTTIVDVLGQIGFDPGAEWGTGLTSTADNTLNRKNTVCAGDLNGSDVFDPSIEWDGSATDTFTGLGAHTANCGATLPNLTINDVSANENNAGTTSFDFTISLSSPAGAGGVTFDIGTQDNSATLADNDYVTNSLTGQTIPAGNSTYMFSVLVNGDTATEPDETFFVNVTNVVGATVTDGQGQGTILNDDTNYCAQTFTPIYSIQGSGLTPAITGVVTTKGVVVGDYEGPSPTQRGFFIQDESGDGNPATSDGIFVFNGNNNSVSLGDVVFVTGTAADFQDQTQLSSVTNITVCGTGTMAPVDVTFPVSSTTFLEQYEGMLVRLPQTLYVTEHFQLGRFGQVVLSVDGKLKQPTNVVAPGAPALALQAQNNLSKIILDDASQGQNPDPILFGRNGSPLSASNTLRGGDTATNIIGVMTYTWAGNAASGNAYRVRPINALNGFVNFVEANSRPTSAPVVGGNVKVVGMNLLNFFNTFADGNAGTPGCFPGGGDSDCRGANSATEFTRQYQKTVAAILAMDPDLIGVNEIENDGYGPTSALQFLVDQLNAATAPGTYAFIDVDAATGQTNAMGTDAIKVALLYKPGVVTPIGQTSPLNTVAFVNGGDPSPRSRPSLAQAFQLNSNGAVFIVDVNHLKSKGSACTAPDAGDGQGNCNQVRVNAATELMNFLATDPTGTGDPDILLVGDYNSYAMEDPISVIETAGFTNLIKSFLGPNAYSYVFDGQWGYLDHALGSASLVSQVSGVGDYHINADEPAVLDYNVEFKSAGQVVSLYAPDQFRVSDHDSVVIGLDLNAPPTVDAGGPYNAVEGGSVLVTGAGSDPDFDALTYDWDLDNNGSFETPGQAVNFVVGSLDGPNSYTIKVRVTDTGNLFAIATTTVNVANVAPTAVLSAPAVVNEGASFVVSFSGAADPSNADTVAGFHYAFNCTGGSLASATYATSGTSSSVSCMFPTHGLYTVRGKIMDKDDGSNEYTVLVLALNVTTILDNFNRANGAIGANWKGSTGTNFYRIASNQVDVRGNGPIYWKNAFGVNQEVSVILTTVDAAGLEQDLLLKVQGGATPNWGSGVIEVFYNAPTNSVMVSTFRPATLMWFTYPAIPVTFANGDQFGAQALANGDVVIFKNGVEVGRVTMNAADQAFFNSKGGYIGLWFINATSAFFDNFGGGTLP